MIYSFIFIFSEQNRGVLLNFGPMQCAWHAVLYVRADKFTASINIVHFSLALTLASAIFPKVNGNGSGANPATLQERNVNFFRKVSN